MIARAKKDGADANAGNSSKTMSKLETLHDKLADRYGDLGDLHIQDTLDLTIFSVVMLRTPLADGLRAYQVLKTQFVDWNEVRISSAKEVQQVLKEADEPLEVALFIKDALHYMFDVRHHVGLEFLRENTISEIRTFFKKAGRFSESTVNLVLEAVKDYPVLPLEADMIACLEKLGVLDGTATPLQAMKDLYPQLPREKVLSMYLYLIEHARSGCPALRKSASKAKARTKKS